MDMEKEFKSKKKIVFEIDPELHKRIKIIAARRNISMNLWIIRALLKSLEKEVE